MQLVRRKCRFHRVVSRSFGESIVRIFRTPRFTCSTQAIQTTGKDGNKHWIPTQKVTFEKPLQAGAPPKKIVLKIPRKGESNVDGGTFRRSPTQNIISHNI